MGFLAKLNPFRAKAPDRRAMISAFVAGRNSVRARYDAAATTPDNRRHWINADTLSASAANSPAVRQILRTRARYEVANNSYARGMILTLANDVVGTGPRLQIQGTDPESARRLERSFASWAIQVKLAEKLRTMRMSRVQDGEAFAMFTTNESLKHEIKLDIRLVEADQVSTPSMFAPSETEIDGIVLDKDHNPVEYHVLKSHPGGMGLSFGDYDKVPADAVIHWFRADRPGQFRAIPEIMPALPLFAELRRFTLAVIAAAESAADFAVLLETTGDGDTEDAVIPFDTAEIEKRMMTALPHGTKALQMKAEQPTTTYKEFKGEILNEIARCLNMPFNIAACNSAGYNYSSGRLDHQTYFRSIVIDQCHCEEAVLDRILSAFLNEAALVPGLLPSEKIVDLSHAWFWDAPEHVDPQKEANAQKTRLASGTTHRAREYARAGLDCDEEDRKAAESFGVTVQEYRAKIFANTFSAAPLPVAAAAPAEELEEEEVEE